MGAPPAEDGDRDLYIGSSTAWELPPGSQVGMLEVSGRGFGAQMARLQQVEQHMQALGAGMLKDKAGVEAADTARLRAAASPVPLSDIVGTAELALNQAIELAKIGRAHVCTTTPHAHHVSRLLIEP